MSNFIVSNWLRTKTITVYEFCKNSPKYKPIIPNLRGTVWDKKFCVRVLIELFYNRTISIVKQSPVNAFYEWKVSK